MKRIKLNEEEISTLKTLHKSAKNKRKADKIKTILFLDEWFTIKETSRLLLLDEDTIGTIRNKFLDKWIDNFLEDNYKSYCWKLTTEQENEIVEFVRNNIIMDSWVIVDYIAVNFNKKYTKQWVGNMLHRLNFVYKKTKKIPAKASKMKQFFQICRYKILKATLKENETILFIDWVHPVHNVMNQYWWIEKWKEKEIKSNTWRNRININWAYNVDTQELITVESEMINAQSTIELYKKIEKKYSDKETILVFRDNAKYYSNKLVKEYLKTSRIKEVPLPTYSPNLNPIERLWGYFKKEVLYNKYYEQFDDFKKVVTHFFWDDFSKHKSKLSTYVIDNFRVMWF